MKQVLHTWDTESDEYETPTFSPLKPDNLISCTFLATPTEDGHHFCTCVIHCIEETDVIKETDVTSDKVHT